MYFLDTNSFLISFIVCWYKFLLLSSVFPEIIRFYWKSIRNLVILRLIYYGLIKLHEAHFLSGTINNLIAQSAFYYKTKRFKTHSLRGVMQSNMKQWTYTSLELFKSRLKNVIKNYIILNVITQKAILQQKFFLLRYAKY